MPSGFIPPLPDFRRIGSTPDPFANLPSGSFSSEGLDDDHRLLTTDIRPFGSDSTWFLFVDFGDNPSRVQLDWAPPQLPVDSPLEIVEVDPNNNFSPVVSTIVDMLRESTLEIDESEIETTSRKIFRIQLGSVSENFIMTLQPGWNLVSLPIIPTNPSPAAVFSNNTGSVFAGVIWGFGITQPNQTVSSYFEVKTVTAGEGYWVFINRENPVSVVINGATVDNSLRLREGWNMVGATTRTDAEIPPIIRTQGGPAEVPDTVQYWDPIGGDYIPAVNGSDCLKLLRGHWMLSHQDQVIELFPTTEVCE